MRLQTEEEKKEAILDRLRRQREMYLEEQEKKNKQSSDERGRENKQ